MSSAIFYIQSDHVRPHSLLFDVLFPERGFYFQERTERNHAKSSENLGLNLIIAVAKEINKKMLGNETFCSIDPTQLRDAIESDTKGELRLTREMMLAIITFYIGYFYSDLPNYKANERIKKRITTNIKRGNLEFQKEYYPKIEISENTLKPDLLKSLKELLRWLRINPKEVASIDKSQDENLSEREKFNRHLNRLAQFYDDPNIYNCLYLNNNGEQWFLGPISLDAEIEDGELSDEFEQIEESVLNENTNSENINGKERNNLGVELSEELSNFYSHLKQEFSTIELRTPKFSLPIERMVNLSLQKVDNEKLQLRDNLRRQLEKLSESETDNEPRLKELTEQISELDRELNEKHAIVSLLEEEKDIFIHGPGGAGKSTMLRWIMYGVSIGSIRFEKPIFPIFVELRVYDGSLTDLINVFLDNFHQKIPDYRTHQILILIDGFDEFTHREKFLLNEIKNLKTKYQAQIVFSGREVPHLDSEQLDLTIFKLTAFDIEDIHGLSEFKLGKDQANRLSRIVELRGLEKYLNRPLFTIFVLALIQSELKKGNSLEDTLIKYIYNSGKLLKRILVEEFLIHYERNRSESKSEWKRLKEFEIQLLSQFAYDLTFRQNDSLFIEKDKAKSIIDRILTRRKANFSISTETFFRDTLEHGFLDETESFYGFDKKELKYFFTALHLKDLIKSRGMFCRLYNRENTKRFWRRINRDRWNSIESYLIGIINPSYIVDKKILSQPIEKVHMTDGFVLKLHFHMKLFHQKNYPEEEVDWLKKRIAEKAIFFFEKMTHYHNRINRRWLEEGSDLEEERMENRLFLRALISSLSRLLNYATFNLFSFFRRSSNDLYPMIDHKVLNGKNLENELFANGILDKYEDFRALFEIFGHKSSYQNEMFSLFYSFKKNRKLFDEKNSTLIIEDFFFEKKLHDSFRYNYRMEMCLLAIKEDPSLFLNSYCTVMREKSITVQMKMLLYLCSKEFRREFIFYDSSSLSEQTRDYFNRLFLGLSEENLKTRHREKLNILFQSFDIPYRNVMLHVSYNEELFKMDAVSINVIRFLSDNIQHKNLPWIKRIIDHSSNEVLHIISKGIGKLQKELDYLIELEKWKLNSSILSDVESKKEDTIKFFDKYLKGF